MSVYLSPPHLGLCHFSEHPFWWLLLWLLTNCVYTQNPPASTRDKSIWLSTQQALTTCSVNKCLSKGIDQRGTLPDLAAPPRSAVAAPHPRLPVTPRSHSAKQPAPATAGPGGGCPGGRAPIKHIITWHEPHPMAFPCLDYY